MPLRLKQGPGFQALCAAGVYAALFCLLFVGFFWKFGGTGAGRVAVFPWEVVAVLVGIFFVGAMVLRRVDMRTVIEMILSAVLFLGVWAYAWSVLGEWGLVVAGIVTVAQAFIRRVWAHDLFVILGAAGAALYFAFLVPAFTWGMLLVGVALYDILGGRGMRVARRLNASVIHRGVLPVVLVPSDVHAFFHPFIAEVQGSSCYAMGMAALLFPALIVAHAALFGMIAFWVTAGCAVLGAGWCAWKRVDAPLLVLGVTVLVPYFFFFLFV